MIGNCGECNRRWVCDIDPNECDLWPDPVPMTNADHIRAMSDEELASVIMCPYDVEPNLCYSRKSCYACSLDWLKLPYKEAPNDPT